MKPNLQKDGLRARRRLGFERSSVPSRRSGIALVITLLMLAAITFLAIAFLAMTRRDRAAATAGVDLNISRQMSDAAFARAQAEIVAGMMAQTDMLSYDYIASHNFISQGGFTNHLANLTNVNYDYFSPNLEPMSPSGNGAVAWAQNIANLYYDPRPPVFVTTNGPNGVTGTDFRFWVDVNQNGHFETNGWVTNYDYTGTPTGIVWNNGEPEWIGVLRDPLFPHSATNPFVGRYAYMVLPIGKTLDFNFIHNYSKSLVDGEVVGLNIGTVPKPDSMGPGNWHDGFSRDEGVGSWELNLAAVLLNLNTNLYLTELPAADQYDYIVPQTPFAEVGPNEGMCFNDALSMIYYRYGATTWFPPALNTIFSNAQPFRYAGVDETGAEPTLSSNQFSLPDDPADIKAINNNISYNVPVGYNTNMYYDMEDILDSNKTSQSFVTRLVRTMTTNDTYDQNTFQRLLSSIGTGSSPEYGTYVYSNGYTFYSNITVGPPVLVYATNFLYANSLKPVGGTLPTYLRNKVNLNYDNTYQITNANAPFVPASSNLVSWAPLAFFTNAADLLLRSQEFPVTNLFGQIIAYNHFGIGNIPIYNSTNTSFCYNAQIHRMLQLAANIYQSVAYSNYANLATGVHYPYVFRPMITAGNDASGAFTVTITNFMLVTNTSPNWKTYVFNQPFYALSDSNNIMNNLSHQPWGPNIWGVPWVVGAMPRLPSFNRVSQGNFFTVSRNLIFTRYVQNNFPVANKPPQYTNQFYVMTITNLFGVDAWNSSLTNFTTPCQIYSSNFVTVQVTNNAPPPYNFGYNTNISSITNFPITLWKGGRFISFFQTNVTSLQPGYYSPYYKTFTNFSSVLAAVDDNQAPTFALPDLEQKGCPEYNWSVMITNRIYYALADQSYNLLDFVNLAFGTSNSIITDITNRAATQYTPSQNVWAIGNANYTPSSPASTGTINEIITSMNSSGGVDAQASLKFANDMRGTPNTGSGTDTNDFYFSPPFAVPTAVAAQNSEWVANDPLVHYTVDDLFWPGQSTPTNVFLYPNNQTIVGMPLTNTVGTLSGRVQPWTPSAYSGNSSVNIGRQDALITGSDAWQFPTNVFPGVGWLGRVHRGTPWQTVYLKANSETIPDWLNWVYAPATSQPTYPTTDWPLIDLFMATPNDNAARGLLSVNQTNDAAWAAVFAGVIALTNSTGGVAINPTNDIYYIMDTNGVGINTLRTNFLNGNFHHIGDILAASGLTVDSPFVPNPSIVPDYVTERIPQQTLSLLKLGMPQFVIYAWGQSLRPKQLYLSSGPNQNICTNYEITGEYLSRVVCHIVNGPIATSDLVNGPPDAGTQGSPKIVIDSYNIEPGN